MERHRLQLKVMENKGNINQNRVLLILKMKIQCIQPGSGFMRS